MVGMVRRRLVTSAGFLRRPVLRYAGDHWVGPEHRVAYAAHAIGLFIRDTLGVVSDAVRVMEWLIRATAEAVGRLAGAPYVIEARLESGLSLFWKVPGRRPVAEAIDEVFQAMSIGDLDFEPPDAERPEVD
jgi:hypothetical protein